MKTAGSPRILLCAERPELTQDLIAPLHNTAFPLSQHAFSQGDPPDPVSYHLVLVVGSGEAALATCRRLRARMVGSLVPILLILDDHTPSTRLAALDAGADTYLLRPFEPGELLAQVRAFLRIKEEHERLTEQTAEVHRINRRLHRIHQQIDGELALARRIQTSLLPQSLPQVSGVRFAAYYQPHGHVGGDFYDVFRLDEHHISLYVADAMGHGIPAALLTIFVKKGVKAKEVFGHEYRLVPPGEVLQRLNRDLVEQALPDQPFITIAYAVFDQRQRIIRFARAGHPYPLHIPKTGEPTLWQIEGSLLGVFDTVYPEQTHTLAVGDKVLLYSDGIDTATFEEAAPGSPSLLACAQCHRDRPIQEFVACLARDLFGSGTPPDDLTLLGLEVVAEGERQE